MKEYYKIVDGKTVFYYNSIILNDMRIFNPTEEQLFEAGYQEWVPPVVEPVPVTVSLDDAKYNKISEINEYDKSENVNSFTINGITDWISRNTRVALLHAIDVVEQNNGTEYTVWLGGVPLTLPTQTIKQFLTTLELYAIEAFNVTNRHIYEVNNLTTVEDVEQYNITAGYPEKININIEI